MYDNLLTLLVVLLAAGAGSSNVWHCWHRAHPILRPYVCVKAVVYLGIAVEYLLYFFGMVDIEAEQNPGRLSLILVMTLAVADAIVRKANSCLWETTRDAKH